MLVKTKAIVISSLKYQEKSLIVKCFTLSDGLKSYFIRDAFSSKKTSQKIAFFQPLSILEIEAVHKNKGTLESIKEIRLAIPFQTIHSNIAKSSIALFLSEILHHSIHEEEKNESLFTFLETAFLWFDNQPKAVEFHLLFMIEMTKYLGFYPDISNLDYHYFDVQAGCFLLTQNISSLNQTDTDLFKKILTLKFDYSASIFTNSERQKALKILIDYYIKQVVGFKEPKSLAVLNSVFL